MDAPMPTEFVCPSVVLTDLPEEVLALILTALDLPDACAALSTCKYIHDTFKSSIFILYAHHTRIAGVLDNSSRRDDFSTRLLELKNSERAWRQLTISHVKNIGIPHRPSGIYDLTGGKYFLGRTDGIPTFTNATGATKAICSLSLSDYFENDVGMQNASASADQPGEWPSIDVGEDIIDVGINSSEHDLIGVVTTAIIWGEATRPKRRVSLHLIQMSTGSPHPEARVPVVPIYEAHDLDTRPSIMLEVVGDVMALLLNWHQIRNSPDVFYIIDWKAGRITMERALDLFHYYSFIFLAPDVLALSCSKPFSIQLARLPRTWDTPPLPGQKPAELEIARTLLLPSLEDNVWVTHFSCRSEPNPTVYGRRYGRCRERNFTPDPRDAIALFHVLVRKITTPIVWGEASSMSFVAHRATLLSLIDWEPPDEAYSRNQKPSTSLNETPASPVSVTNEGSPSSEDAALTPLSLSNGESACEQVTGKEIRTIPWTTWGNKATQWFPTDHILTNWITTSCGTRLVLTEEPESETGSNLTVYDFNWNRVKKAIKAAQYLRDAEYESEAWECPANPLTMDEESTFAVDNAQSVIPGAWITSNMAEGTPEQDNPPVASVNPEGIEGYPVGDCIFEEWTMNGDDRVLGRSENNQQSGDIRLINGDIPLPPSTNRFFKEQVVGGLPFIAVKRVVEETYQSVLMEEECLIGLKATNDDGINSIDILHVG